MEKYIKDFADKENMIIVGEYVDAGKFGKNIAGRPQFIQMMEDIQGVTILLCALCFIASAAIACFVGYVRGTIIPF